MTFTQCFIAPCFRSEGQTLDQLCAQARAIGYTAIEHWHRGADWEEFCAAAKKHGLRIASFVGHQSLAKGVANAGEHERILGELRTSLAEAKARGIGNLIVLTGNREHDVTDAEHRAHAAACLARIAPEAEAAGVNLNLEYLNTRVDHPDYCFNKLEWGLDVVRRVNSPRVKILLDLYHRQIMEGDLVRALKEAKDHIGHIHTAGNPGRHELDESQEINWAAVARGIAAIGYTGFVSHEFFPTGDKIAALRQAYEVCSVGGAARAVGK